MQCFNMFAIEQRAQSLSPRSIFRVEDKFVQRDPVM